MVASIKAIFDNTGELINSCPDIKATAELLVTLPILTSRSRYSVADVASLPPANENTGRFFYVEELDAYRYSDGEIWTNDFTSTVTLDPLIGELWTWGRNLNGELGEDSTVSRSSPGTTAGGGTTWCQVSSGGSPTAAVKTDGTLWTWGSNSVGQLGSGNTVPRSSPGTTAGGGTTWCQVSSGGLHTAAIKSDGTLWTWGRNSAGQIGTGGTGSSLNSPVTTAGGGTTWCQVSAGGYHTAAVKTDGTLWAWGCNNKGQLGDNSIINKPSPVTTAGGGNSWCQVSASRHTAAVKTDGTLWSWGCNFYGNLGIGSTVSRSSPGTTAGGGTTWCQVSSGGDHTAAIKTDGTLWTWGSNSSGRLGTGNLVCVSSPVTTAGGGTTWCQAAAGSVHTVAIKTEGTLWTWGANCDGSLGTGTTVNRSSPGTTAGGGTTWCQVSGGFQHTAAIRGQSTGKGF